MHTDGQADIDRVRDATDLLALVSEHVALRPRGREHVGLCPFHEDRKPSFAVVTHKGDPFYKCFACGAGGDCFRFVMDYHRMEFGEALRYLAERAGVTLTPRGPRSRAQEGQGGVSREEMRQACAGTAQLYRRFLLEDEAGAPARAYLSRRGVSDATAETFGLGAAPPGYDTLFARIADRPRAVQTAVAAGLLRTRDSGGHYDTFRNRLIFPICDTAGRTVAFGARALDPEDTPKYLNSPESALFHKSDTLYGLHLAQRAIVSSAKAAIVEGYTDVIACHQAGITNVVATLGTALTSEHVRRLARLAGTIVLVFDGDAAGVKAAERGVAMCFAEEVSVLICVLPDGLDPDEMIKRDGAEALTAAIEAAPDALAYDFEQFRIRHGVTSDPALRARITSEYLDRLAELGLGGLVGVRRQVYVARVADLLGMSVEATDRELASRKRRPTSRRSGHGVGATGGPGSSRTGSGPSSSGKPGSNEPRPTGVASRIIEPTPRPPASDASSGSTDASTLDAALDAAIDPALGDGIDPASFGEDSAPDSPSRGGIDPEADALSEPASDPAAESASIGRARRLAERHLLCVALSAPAVLDDDAVAPLDELVDPASRCIAGALLAERDTGRSPTMQRVLGRLEDPRLRSVAIQLYDQGVEAGFDEDPNLAGTAYADATTVLREQIRRAQNSAATSGAARNVHDLLSAVEAIRAAGDRPDAISTRYRD